MDKYKDTIKAAINNAITNNYVDFSKNIQQAVQLKTNEHPGVQAYKEDMSHYQGISNALSSVGDYEKKEDPVVDSSDSDIKDETNIPDVPENEETSVDDESEDNNSDDNDIDVDNDDNEEKEV